MTDTDPDDVDPRRALWRRGSYEIVGDWIARASVAVLDRVAEVVGEPLDGRRVLDVATGTGAVAIEAARRGASVVGIDLTDELVEIARRRADDTGVDVRFVIGDFDELDGQVSSDPFDVITSSFGVIFSPDPSATLSGLGRLLASGGVIGVAGWDPAGVFIPSQSLIELFPERPPMLDMSPWTTEIESLCAGTSFDVAATHDDELLIPFASVADAADQLERWAGGWAQLFEAFDGAGVGAEARSRFVDHLASFAVVGDGGIQLRARYHVSVLRRGA